MINNELKELDLRIRKRRALNDAVDAAASALSTGDPEAYDVVKTAFWHYRQVDPDDYHNIKDVYWLLPQNIRDLWNADPDLKAWGDKFW